MPTQKILTLQFGNYTNYVGAHFWNLQELSSDRTEFNRDILFSECQSNGEVTYTPRLLLCDLKGSMNTYPKFSCGLPDWDVIDNTEESPAPKNKDLDEEVNKVGPSCTATVTKQFKWCIRSWTDYLYPKLHPRSINILKEYCHGSDGNGTPFETFNTGKATWNSYFGEEFREKIRIYFEECDSIQGFHVNFDCTDAFSGLAIGCIEHLVDEYTIDPIIAYPIMASYYPDNSPSTQREADFSRYKDTVRLTNTLLSFQALSEYSDLFAPLCTGLTGWRKPGDARRFEYVHYDPKAYYHSSSILASALDTLSLKYRLMDSEYTMSDICADMTRNGRKMVASSIGIPFPIDESEYLLDVLRSPPDPLYHVITPSCEVSPEDEIFQLITVRGIPEGRLRPPVQNSKQLLGMEACTSVKEMFELFFGSNNYYAETNITVCRNPLETKDPFPKYFARGLNKYGFINGNKKEIVESCPVIAGYHNGNFIRYTIDKLHTEASSLKFCQLHKFEEEGLEVSEFRETLNKLAEFTNSYREGENDDDDDDDDCE